MSNLEKFYNKIFEDIEILVEEKKINSAIEILEDELDAPYIPINFQEKFEEKLLELKFEKNYLNDEKKIEKISKIDFFEKNEKKISDLDVIYFFKKFEKNLSENEIQMLIKKMESKDIYNSKKIIILENIKNLKINKTLYFWNNNTKKMHTLNLENILFIESIDFFIKTNEKLNNIMSKEPTIIELCYTIVYSFYEYFFPVFVFTYTYNEFVLGIINVVENMLKGTNLNNNEVSKDILKVIKKMK